MVSRFRCRGYEGCVLPSSRARRGYRECRRAIFDAYYGMWVGSIVGGDLALATAETCRRDAESSGRRTDAAVAHRYLGLTYLSRGQFTEARTNLEQALRIYDVERDREANLRYGVDTGAGARIYLALADWHLGDFARVEGLIRDGAALALETRATRQLGAVYVLSRFCSKFFVTTPRLRSRMLKRLSTLAGNTRSSWRRMEY